MVPIQTGGGYGRFNSIDSLNMYTECRHAILQGRNAILHFKLAPLQEYPAPSRSSPLTNSISAFQAFLVLNETDCAYDRCSLSVAYSSNFNRFNLISCFHFSCLGLEIEMY